MSARWLAAVAIVAAMAGSAAADDAPVDVPTVTYHLTLGGEAGGGAGFGGGGFRAHAGASYASGSSRVRPLIGLGATFGTNGWVVPDDRAINGELQLAQVEGGPQLTLGLRFANGGWYDNRIYLSGAVLASHFTKRAAVDAIDPDTSRGVRFAIGANFTEALVNKTMSSTGRKDDASWLAILVPGQLELATSNTTGSWRVMFGIAWGL